MATAFIREWRDTYRPSGSNDVPIVAEPAVTTQTVTYTTTTASAVFNADSRIIRVFADAAFHYEVGAAPTATASSMKHPAGVNLEFAVAGPLMKIAIYDGTS